jgi:hypothetical protein
MKKIMFFTKRITIIRTITAAITTIAIITPGESTTIFNI